MTTKDKEIVLFTWSGGKDSALAFYNVRISKRYEIIALLTTVTDEYKRTSMHGVREVLLEKQAASIGIPLDIMSISKDCSNEEYESRMHKKLLYYKKKGVTAVVYGDIFLDELRSNRENNLIKLDMKGLFPLWKTNTFKVAATFIDLGFKSIVTCIDSEKLDKKFVGCEYNKEFINELPDEVDICGENGEFHTFVYDGPIFKEKIQCIKGEVVLRDNRYFFCDLIPG
ncbi:MAG: diphthine--ammonia ligase [Spirochaetota bacterium]|nr:MAG: diphthine--ammonia ligase [Spirochaetota bacterium]